LFFSDEVHSNIRNEKKFTLEEFQEGVEFFVNFSRGSFGIPTSNQMGFLVIYPFHTFVVQSYYLFFFPGFTLASISQTEFEECQQKIQSLNNTISDLSSELSTTHKTINQQTSELSAQSSLIQQEINQREIQEEKFAHDIKNLKQNFEKDKEELTKDFQNNKQELIQEYQRKFQIFEKEFHQRIENERIEWKNIIEQFEHHQEMDNSNQQEVFQLRLLFLQHISLKYIFQKENSEIRYEFQTALDEFFQNDNLDIFF
jgi:isoleucyl-tRNA synthetase